MIGHQDEPMEPVALEVDPPEEQERPQRLPAHMARLYAGMGTLGPKGLWEKNQRACSMRAYLARGQNVVTFNSLKNERFGRLDRKRAVDALVKAGAVKVVPRNVRETAGTIHPATVDALLESLPDEAKASPEAVTRTIGRLFKIEDYGTIARRTLRAKRFMLNNPDRRVPMHVREGAVLSTAIAVAIAKLFPDTCEPEHLEAVRILREKYGEPKEVASAEAV